jgi:hypothetical protein
VTTAPTALDEIIPEYEFGHHYARFVAAAPAEVYAALGSFRMDRDAHPLVRLPLTVLFVLRGLGRPPGGGFKDSAVAGGFSVLAERPDEEIVLGVAGRFWALDERGALIKVPSADAFREFAVPGTAKAAMSFRCEPLPDGTTRLVTETRVECVDREAYWKFSWYWALIEPFSAWIRRAMLGAVERRITDTASSRRGVLSAA